MSVIPVPLETVTHMTRNSCNNARIASGAGFKRLLLFTGLFLLLTAAGVYAVYGAVAGHAFAFDARLLSWKVLAPVIALLLVYFLADGLRLHYTLKALGQVLPLALIFRLVFVNIFFSNVTPLATGGGFAQIWFLQRKGVPLGTATAAATVRTLLAIVFIFSAAPLVLLLFVPDELYTPGRATLLPLGIFIALYIVFFFILLFRTRWLLTPICTVLDAMLRWQMIGTARHLRWQFGSKREMLRFAQGFRKYLMGNVRHVLLSVFYTILFLFSLFSFPALLLWGLDYDVAYLRTVGLTALTTFVMYFSPTPGAAGIAEGVFGKLFAGVVDARHLVLVTLAWRFLTIHTGMLVGAAATHHELTRGGDTACPHANASRSSSI